MRILLAEDDEDLGAIIKEGLTKKHYMVDWVKNGNSALLALKAKNEHFDLAILDINMPQKSGLEVLSIIRKNNNSTPVFLLTAKDQTADKIAGLDYGADDYIVKPFDLEELCARIRSIIRRSAGRSSATIKIGDIELDPANYTVKLKNEIHVFSRREFSILQKLMEKNKTVVTKEMLSQTIYGWNDKFDSNTIEVHIHNLRKKIKDSASIRTIRGVGYLIEDATV